MAEWKMAFHWHCSNDPKWLEWHWLLGHDGGLVISWGGICEQWSVFNNGWMIGTYRWIQSMGRSRWKCPRKISWKTRQRYFLLELKLLRKLFVICYYNVTNNNDNIKSYVRMVIVIWSSGFYLRQCFPLRRETGIITTIQAIARQSSSSPTLETFPTT